MLFSPFSPTNTILISFVIIFLSFCSSSTLAFDILSAIGGAKNPSNPEASQEELARNLKKPDFTAREPRPKFEEKAFFLEDIKTTCPNRGANIGAYIRWSNEAGSGSFAPPLIYDLLADGRKEIVLPTFTHYIEAMDGETGRDVYDWPFSHPRLKTQASPVVVDIEPDGISEIMISTYYGELLFFTEEGQLRKGKTIRLPRIIVDRNWSRDFKTEDKNQADARKAEINYKGRLVQGLEDQTKKVNSQQQKSSSSSSSQAPKVNSVVGLKQDVAVRGNQAQVRMKEKSQQQQKDSHHAMPDGRPVVSGFHPNGWIKKHKPHKDDIILDDSVVKVLVTTTAPATSDAPAPPNEKPQQNPHQKKDPETTLAPTTTAAAAGGQQQQQQQQQQQHTAGHHHHHHHHHHGNNSTNNNQSSQQQQGQTQHHHHSHHGNPQQQQQQNNNNNNNNQDSDRSLLFDDDELPPVQHQQHQGEAVGEAADYEDFKPPEDWDYHDLEHEDAFDWPNELESNHIKLQGPGAPLSPEAKASMNLAFHPELFEAFDQGDRAKSSAGGTRKITSPGDAATRTYVDPRESVRHEEDPTSFNGQRFDKNRHVYLSPHILATPVVTDLDLDGKFDIIIPVSYFLDTGHPGDDNDPEIDTDLYVVSEVVVVDMSSGKIKWRSRLRTTTKHSDYPGYLMASPVVIDVDMNILLDVVVTTADGMINVFDYRGHPHMGWPVQMAPIHGPALVDDINSDGRIEICAGDVTGTIACFNSRGLYLWDKHLTGEIADGMSAGDVNGDGILDIVVGTSTGQLWAIDGKKGELLPGFPIQISSTDARDDTAIVAPPLLINLNNSHPPLGPERSNGLHIVFPATDGRLYFVSGTTRCIEMIDLGHASYTQVLADDLIGNGKIALVVTTLSGAVHVIETKAAFSPMKAWPSRPVGVNGYTARENRIGIQVHDEFRHAHDVQGDHWALSFDIIDRRFEGLSKVPIQSQHPLYFIIVTYGKRLIAFGGAYREPGTYKIDIPAPPERLHTMVHVYMRVTGGALVEDTFAMSFNAHVLDTAKYILVLPFIAVMCSLWLVKRQHELTHEGMHGGGGMLRRGPNGELIRVQDPYDPWGIYMDEYELEEYLLALERERMLRALRGKSAAEGRYGAAAQAAARRRTQQQQSRPSATQQQQQQQQPKPSSQGSFNDDDV